jgi:hypothetical protein
VSFDPAELDRLSGPRRRRNRPVAAAFLFRVGLAAGVAAALCNVLLLLVAQGLSWDVTVDGQSVQPMAVVVVCVLVAALAALGAYAAARMTKRPALWVVLAGIALWLASLQGLPPAVISLHTVAALWIVGWLARAVRGGTHLTGGG